MSTGKIQSPLYERLAYVYVRQSTQWQVKENRESTERRYHLHERALQLGWAASHVEIIDEDQGRTRHLRDPSQRFSTFGDQCTSRLGVVNHKTADVNRASGPRKPSQRRSRESLRRMLEAAELVIAKYGIDGATLPRIAAAARMAPTSVYRRFRDKDGLIRAVFQRLSERTGAEIENQFVPEKGRSIGLVQFSRNVIVGMVAGYRQNAALSRAAIEYCERKLGNNVCPAGSVGRSARVSADDRLFLGLAR